MRLKQDQDLGGLTWDGQPDLAMLFDPCIKMSLSVPRGDLWDRGDIFDLLGSGYGL